MSWAGGSNIERSLTRKTPEKRCATWPRDIRDCTIEWDFEGVTWTLVAGPTLHNKNLQAQIFKLEPASLNLPILSASAATGQHMSNPVYSNWKKNSVQENHRITERACSIFSWYFDGVVTLPIPWFSQEPNVILILPSRLRNCYSPGVSLKTNQGAPVRKPYFIRVVDHTFWLVFLWCTVELKLHTYTGWGMSLCFDC